MGQADSVALITLLLSLAATGHTWCLPAGTCPKEGFISAIKCIAQWAWKLLREKKEVLYRMLILVRCACLWKAAQAAADESSHETCGELSPLSNAHPFWHTVSVWDNIPSPTPGVTNISHLPRFGVFTNKSFVKPCKLWCVVVHVQDFHRHRDAAHLRGVVWKEEAQHKERQYIEEGEGAAPRSAQEVKQLFGYWLALHDIFPLGTAVTCGLCDSEWSCKCCSLSVLASHLITSFPNKFH